MIIENLVGKRLGDWLLLVDQKTNQEELCGIVCATAKPKNPFALITCVQVGRFLVVVTELIKQKNGRRMEWQRLGHTEFGET